MKKILSCVLAVALVLSLMSMTVFAGEEAHPDNGTVETNKAYRVVGTQGDKKDYTDGADDPNGSATADVNVTFDNNLQDDQTTTIIKHKYAVDIEYKDLIVDMTKVLTDVVGVTDTYEYVWDVNAYEYVLVSNGTEVSDNDNSEEYTMDSFRVINHSDMSIQYTGKATSTNEHIKLRTDMQTAVDAEPTAEIVEKANSQADVEADPTKTFGKTTTDWNQIIATPAVTWLKTANALVAQNITTNSTIGNLVITISATQN